MLSIASNLSRSRCALATKPQSTLLSFVRDVKVVANALKKGSLIDGSSLPGHPDGRILKIEELQHVKPGKGVAFVQTKLRDFVTKQGFQYKFRSAEQVELVELDHAAPFQLLYTAQGTAHLMNMDTFDQEEVDLDLFGEQAIYLQDGMEIKVSKVNGQSILFGIPDRVELTVVAAPPNDKKGKSGDNYKPVTLDNGLKVKAPHFVEAGDRIVINTADNEYVGKA